MSRILMPDGTYCSSGPTCRLHSKQFAILFGNNPIDNVHSTNVKIVPALPPLLRPRNKSRKGLNDNTPENLKIIEDYYNESKTWRSKITEEEAWALSRYSFTSYVDINPYLYNNGFVEENNDKIKISVERTVKLIDSALAKATPSNTARLLYRSYKVKNMDSFLQEHKVGNVITLNAYTSTTLDSDLMVHRSRKYKADSFAVYEIVSKNGVAIHPEENLSPSGFSIQDIEREVLLPRDSKMKVISVLKNVPFVSTHTDRRVLEFTRTARRKNFTVVQLIDVS